VTGGREGKIAISNSPKVIFVTFGEFNFLFGVIEIAFGETISVYYIERQSLVPWHCITARHLRHYGSLITTSKHFNRIEGIEYELACLILPSLNKREKLSGNTKQGFGGVGIKKEKST